MNYSLGIVLRASLRTVKALFWLFGAFCSLLSRDDPILLQKC